MTKLLTEFTEKQLFETMEKAKKEGGCRNIKRFHDCERELERRNKMEVANG